MKYAWLEAQTIRDISHSNPIEIFHPDIAKLYSAQVPDNAENGDTWDGVTLAKREIPAPVPPAPVAVVPPKVSPVQFKLLFTSIERIAIKTSTDPVVQDFFEIVNDPRLTHVDLGLQSTKDALGYMASKSLIGPGRVAEILTGVVK